MIDADFRYRVAVFLDDPSGIEIPLFYEGGDPYLFNNKNYYEILWQGNAKDVISDLNCCFERLDSLEPVTLKELIAEQIFCKIFDYNSREFHQFNDNNKNSELKHSFVCHIQNHIFNFLDNCKVFPGLSVLKSSVLNDDFFKQDCFKNILDFSCLKEPVFVCNSLKNKKLNNKNKSHKI